MPQFLCPHCEQLIEVADEHVGLRLECSLCGRHFTADYARQNALQDKLKREIKADQRIRTQLELEELADEARRNQPTIQRPSRPLGRVGDVLRALISALFAFIFYAVGFVAGLAGLIIMLGSTGEPPLNGILAQTKATNCFIIAFFSAWAATRIAFSPQPRSG